MKQIKKNTQSLALYGAIAMALALLLLVVSRESNAAPQNKSNQEQSIQRQVADSYDDHDDDEDEGRYQSWHERRDMHEAESRELHDKVGAVLKGGTFSKDYAHVRFFVRRDKVILKGSVETVSEKKDVSTRVLGVDGVYSVINKIRVIPKK